MSGHTPGPWAISKRNDAERPYSIISGAETGRAYAVAMCPRYRGEDWEEDARLIAAAPELLEALTWLVRCNDEVRHPQWLDSPAEIAARAAIAKATQP